MGCTMEKYKNTSKISKNIENKQLANNDIDDIFEKIDAINLDN